MSLLPSIKVLNEMSSGIYKEKRIKKSKIFQNSDFYFNTRVKKEKRVNYKLYIKSKKWSQRKKTYYKHHKKECVICGSKYEIGLHHISYKNLGKEHDEDLVSLCWFHHSKYHDNYGVKNKNNKTHIFIEEEKQEIEFFDIVRTLK